MKSRIAAAYTERRKLAHMGLGAKNQKVGNRPRERVSTIDDVLRLRYDASMHLFSKPLLALAFVAFSGCAGGTPNAKSSDGGTPESGADAKQAECNVVENKFKQIDEAVKGVKGTAGRKALVPALEKMSKEFKESPMKTPGLDKATVELVAEADSFAPKLKDLYPFFDEMDEVSEVLLAWQTKVRKVEDEFDLACGKAPRDECDAIGKFVATIPQLEGDGYGTYANELEPFVKTGGDHEAKDSGLRSATKNLLSVMSDGVKPMRRMGELITEIKKRSPDGGQLKAKFNQVREMCGLPVRK